MKYILILNNIYDPLNAGNLSAEFDIKFCMEVYICCRGSPELISVQITSQDNDK